MSRTLLLLWFSLLVSLAHYTAWGQSSLIFTKAKKEIRLFKTDDLTLILKDGSKFKGIIDSVTPSFVMIKTKNSGHITVDVPNIKAFKKHYHLWYIGTFASLIQDNRTFNIEGFKYKFKPESPR